MLLFVAAPPVRLLATGKNRAGLHSAGSQGAGGQAKHCLTRVIYGCSIYYSIIANKYIPVVLIFLKFTNCSKDNLFAEN
jgi:hypothetical protein